MPVTSNDFLARVLMQSSTGLPEDIYVNTFAFKFVGGAGPAAADFDELVEGINRFYNQPGIGANQISDYIGEQVNRAATHEIEFVPILTGGSPIYSSPWLGPAAPAVPGENLPSEVAGVLTFHGNLGVVQEEVGGTRPRARRRGRVYIGPLNRNAVEMSSSQPRLTALFTAALREGALTMHDYLASTTGWQWMVWSRADNTTYPVVGGWTDNAPDTLRKRGPAANTRVTYTV